MWGETRCDDGTEREAGASASQVESAVPTVPGAGGFAWCAPESTSEPEPERETWGTDGLTLDPALATRTRLGGTDDEAVALLAALRRNPSHGRWRRAETELDGE